jgi:fermentation-respiration switch protein FrsA (DUF1100 family)
MQAAAEPVDDNHFLPKDPADLLRQDPSRRVAVDFTSAGHRLAGHLYRPPSASKTARTPGIVMCGPFSSVKEQTMPHYAERFADAGYTVLTFDPRGYGESEGEPRGHYDPAVIIEDYSTAANYLMRRPDIDAARTSVVGVCMGGGFAISVGARNKKLAAVVSVAGGFNIGGTFQQFMGPDGFAAYLRKINEMVQREQETGEVAYVPTIAMALSDDVPVAAMPLEEAYTYYDRTSRLDAPTWSNQTTARCLEAYFSYNAVAHAPLVAPTPMLIMHGTKDLALLPEYAQAAYDAAIGPKELVWIETHNHIEVYDQRPYVDEAAATVIEWLGRTLAR